jgi:hypothetical protein
MSKMTKNGHTIIRQASITGKLVVCYSDTAIRFPLPNSCNKSRPCELYNRNREDQELKWQCMAEEGGEGRAAEWGESSY